MSLSEEEFNALTTKETTPDYRPRGGARERKDRVPVPERDEDYGDPRADLLKFLDMGSWQLIYQQLTEARDTGGNPLADAVQALLCEVGQQCGVRVYLNKLVGQEDKTEQGLISAIEYLQMVERQGLFPQELPDSLDTAPSAQSFDLNTLQLALQSSLEDLDTAPGKLSIKDFRALCEAVAEEVING